MDRVTIVKALEYIKVIELLILLFFWAELRASDSRLQEFKNFEGNKIRTTLYH